MSVTFVYMQKIDCNYKVGFPKYSHIIIVLNRCYHIVFYVIQLRLYRYVCSYSIVIQCHHKINLMIKC